LYAVCATNVLKVTTNIALKCDINVVKVKQSPLQALTGPGGSRRLRLPDFKIIGT
jgi:hypothetical protein